MLHAVSSSFVFVDMGWNSLRAGLAPQDEDPQWGNDACPGSQILFWFWWRFHFMYTMYIIAFHPHPPAYNTLILNASTKACPSLAHDPQHLPAVWLRCPVLEKAQISSAWPQGSQPEHLRKQFQHISTQRLGSPPLFARHPDNIFLFHVFSTFYIFLRHCTVDCNI